MSYQQFPFFRNAALAAIAEKDPATAARLMDADRKMNTVGLVVAGVIFAGMFGLIFFLAKRDKGLQPPPSMMPQQQQQQDQ